LKPTLKWRIWEPVNRRLRRIWRGLPVSGTFRGPRQSRRLGRPRRRLLSCNASGRRSRRRLGKPRRRTQLRRLRAALEQQETELLHKEVTVVTLTGTLREKGEALEEKEVALQNVGTTLKEKEDSLSSLEEVVRVQREEAQRSITGKYLRVSVGLFLFVAYVDFLCSELRQKVADESEAKEAVHTALTAA